MPVRTKWLLGAAVVMVALVAAACSSSSKSGGASTVGSSNGTTAAGSTPLASGSSENKSSAPGVTPTEITVGVQTSLTGPASSQYVGITKGVQARFGLQNAQGGVFGRQLKFITEDDESSLTAANTVAQYFSTKSVFGVIGESAFITGGYRVYQQHGIPVTGGGYDGPEWEQQPDTNMFAVDPSYPGYPQYTTGAQFIKDNGGTNVACIGYSLTSSKAGADGCATAAKALGLKSGYTNDSLGFGTVNVTPIALAMKNGGIDAAYLAMDTNTNLAILTAAKQAGVNLKVALPATGYGQDLLNDSSAAQAAQGAYFLNLYQPVELNTAATQQLTTSLRTYAGYTGIPGFDYAQGWLAADLMIKGLQLAGQNPTRQSFIANLSKVTSYDGGGLLAAPVNYAAFGKPPATSCTYFAQLVGAHFVVKGGKPVCGTLLP